MHSFLHMDRPEIYEQSEAEKNHYFHILNAFQHYKKFSVIRLEHEKAYFFSLSERQKSLVPDFETHCKNIMIGIDSNYQFIIKMLKPSAHIFQNGSNLLQNKQNLVQQLKAQGIPTTFDMEKVDSTIKQFYRDWSHVGQLERIVSYGPILKDLQIYLPITSIHPNKRNVSPPCVLIPGCGLGRLVFEIAKLGYTAQGNEWSLYMLFASNFVLNHIKCAKQYTIYPWLHQYTNNYKSETQYESIDIPDVNPSDLSSPCDNLIENSENCTANSLSPAQKFSNFSMCAGDFLEVYDDQNDVWDAIATCFFIDTAHNILDYFEMIYKILKPGGFWFNFGPLLYHYADMPNEKSIELSYAQCKTAIEKLGFKFLKEELNIPCTYAQNPSSMLKYVYDCVYFVVQK